MSARQSEALVALQAALTAVFNADTTLTQLVGGRIHDGAPAAAVTPFLSFGDARGADWSTSDGPGARLSFDIEVIGGDQERARTVRALDRAVALATGSSLVLATGLLVLIRQTGMDVRKLADGRRWRAQASFDALIE